MQWVWGIALILVVESISGYSCAQSVRDSKPTVAAGGQELIQVSMLALNKDYGPLPTLVPDNVTISLDSGPIFHPTQMHVEAGEPLSLAIVLDASGDQNALLHNFAASVRDVARSSLGQRDTFTLFAIDCRIVRTSLNQTVTPSAMSSAVSRALASPDLHGTKKSGACGSSLHLWDAAAFAAKELAKASGRRVLIIVSDGEDHGSTTWWNDLRAFAADQSIAIFGLRDLDRLGGNYVPQFPHSAAGVYYRSNNIETRFRKLSELTGGLILATPAKELTESMARLIAFIRGRYVLEFPRPNEPRPGGHTIDVTLPGLDAYVVTSGVTIPLLDADAERHPKTDPSTYTPPVMGQRRILPKAN